MYLVSVESHFEAAHYLREYGGKCESLHGHRFKVVATLKAEKLNKIGLSYDFTDLKRLLEPVMAKLDHKCVNDVPPFDRLNASSENIARYIYEELKPHFAAGDVSLASVEVWESPTSHVTYYE